MGRNRATKTRIAHSSSPPHFVNPPKCIWLYTFPWNSEEKIRIGNRPVSDISALPFSLCACACQPSQITSHLFVYEPLRAYVSQTSFFTLFVEVDSRTLILDHFTIFFPSLPNVGNSLHQEQFARKNISF